jgi:hypothetical protein
MPRWILRYHGRGTRPDADVERIAALSGVAVVDDSNRMLLVEGPEDTLRGVLAALPDWTLNEERPVPLPDVRRRPRTGS